jgi:hypothetical protein
MLRSGILTGCGKFGFDGVTERAIDHDVDVARCRVDAARCREDVSSQIQ